MTREYGSPPQPVAMPEMADGIFRNFVWGVSKQDVRKFENARFYKEEDNSLYFLEQPSKRDFRRIIRYDFRDGKLWRASYEFQELDTPNADTIMEIQEDVKRALAAQYGEPDEENFIWRDPYYRRYPQFWGRALLGQQLRLETLWEKGETKVVLKCRFEGPHYYLGYTAERQVPGQEQEFLKDIVPKAPEIKFNP
jgi:hypothetical protein